MHRETIPTPQQGLALNLKSVAEDHAYHIRGDVSAFLRDAKTGETQLVWTRKNLIVRDASILIARLMKDPSEPSKGVFALAVGSGDSGWNLQSPPAATATQRSLYAELGRKTFASTRFVDTATGSYVAYPTNVVDFQVVFTESEAVGPLVEMALVGGNVSTNLGIRNPVLPPNGTYNASVNLTQYETLINYLTFPVINKPATSTLEIVWRLTF